MTGLALATCKGAHQPRAGPSSHAHDSIPPWTLANFIKPFHRLATSVELIDMLHVLAGSRVDHGATLQTGRSRGPPVDACMDSLSSASLLLFTVLPDADE